MTISRPLKKTLFVSLLGHLTLFSIFSFSFGRKIPAANYSGVFFWGAILRPADLSTTLSVPRHSRNSIKNIFLKTPQRLSLNESSIGYLKPAAAPVFNTEKITFMPKAASALPVLPRKEPVLIFHPMLPYQFTIYFKDRQKAHIELLFNITLGQQSNSITIKRRISSGNLEADLLTMRYIGHYLFIQQARFSTNKWQSVKIDLSTKHD